MRVLLIDADSVIPNIPLMKLSSYCKRFGHSVELVRVGLPYYPNRKKRQYVCPIGFDFYFCSVVFSGNKEYIKGDNIIFGGTGVDLTTVLPDEVDAEECDYSIYPDNDTSYGFITRGCIRNCFFCVVPKKEGMIRLENSIDSIVRHKKTKFLDNNILAYPGHLSILEELVSKKIRCCFNQGLDIRLITSENSKLLSKLNYMKEYVFAFDSWKYKEIIQNRLPLLRWAGDWRLKFFVYVHPDMPIRETVKRIVWLKEHKCLPYIMRDISCWGSKFNEFYIDICAYCNQVHLFKKMLFGDFLLRRHCSVERIERSLSLWNDAH